MGCDVYPYTAGSTQLLHILPPEFLEGGMDAVVRRLADPHERETLAHRIEDGGGFDDIAKLVSWDGIFLSSLHCPEDAPLLGKSIAQEAAMEHKSPLDVCCDLLIREHCQVTMIDFMAAEEDIAAILRSPLSCLISDATYPTEGMPHPRVYGSCTRLLQHFVREQSVLTLEQGVHKLTQAPAQALRLAGKGVIAVGADADLCVFDPAALTERGTYQDPLPNGPGYGRRAGGRPAGREERRNDRREGWDPHPQIKRSPRSGEIFYFFSPPDTLATNTHTRMMTTPRACHRLKSSFRKSTPASTDTTVVTLENRELSETVR